ncbi:MAG TPA: DUF4097 family beta strand repeat-containing protein, partial [Gemmatimonadaceae bacterium]|nr:DUF4097 family beta strand repeat-containing protein [Gemmatimonadaceae bacterium]
SSSALELGAPDNPVPRIFPLFKLSGLVWCLTLQHHNLDTVTMLNISSIIRVLVVIAALVPPTRAVAQRDDARWIEDCRENSGDRWRRRETYCEVREMRVRAPSDNISMDGLRNGGVSVSGWDRDSLVVRTRIQVTARTQSDARDIARQIRTTLRGSTVVVEGPRHDDDDEHWSASLIANVPRRTNLTVGTSNGPVTVENVKGDISLRTSNGPMTLRDLAGSVNARTTNGPLSISLSGNRWDGSGLEARTTNGPLTISVPDSYNAHLEAGTTNGPVSLGFPITVVGRITRDISTDLGSGGATIRATTTNGPLSIRRR